ncbi:MAG TPA: leucine-rich repeat domain-containing protein [Spirochaetota bacterium]|nr:leucine-rich repeat domain-containing protein [Spirochaetota bacterium]HPF05061.1 leucine-rich repeat domain-containing protein [Spirochaetota bacterium]HPJ41465.1 leucine-rich repeat domain-containing protein [Spirochaetota bacterium]HPR38630.1 leucine-rich repeat domain-containing protein [Spirochaetota bacterium]HRX46602.1 leucine-rich repeat domain-containing protein [Spirochaetota bacterium]
MSVNTNELYDELKKNITSSRLKDMSIEVISRYKKKDNGYLASLAERVGISSAEAGISRVFSQLIQLYHPDRLKKIMGEIELHKKTGNTDELARIKGVYLIDMKRVQIKDFTFEADEKYLYEDDEPVYDEYEEYYDDGEEIIRDHEYEDVLSEETVAGEEYGFIEAVNDLYLGNLEYELTLADLQNLEGELDLSGFDLEDLTGAEYCLNITSLNLSGNRIYRIHQLAGLAKLEVLYLSDNRIDDITFLEGLTELRELDISFNDVEDISVLLELPNLQYLNLVENPVSDETVIDELQDKGIIVIY